jgi:hypothetical protein
MQPRKWVLALAILSGCGSAPEPASVSFPAVFGRDWKLESAKAVPEAGAPDGVRRLGLRTASQAHYKGQHDVIVTLYRMSSESSAFELHQQWRPEEGKLAFHKGDLFIVLESEPMDIHGLTAVAEDFEEALDKARQ